MAKAFEAKGDLSEARLVFDIFPKTPGALLTYEALSAQLGRDFHLNRSPYYTALRWMQTLHSRTAENVPGVGYRVLSAGEHVKRADWRGARSARQLRDAVHVLQHVRREEMDESQVRRNEAHESIYTADLQLVRRRTHRIRKAQASFEALRCERAPVPPWREATALRDDLIG